MGAEQSSPRTGGGAPANTATPRKTCYYELLGIERQASEDEIKKAYRKKALELHPDRNINDVENATQRFALVQTAYEILSDPQERAWYDSHRDAILSGNDDVGGGGGASEPGQAYNVRLTSAEEIFSLMGRFSAAVPMTDGPRGFFGILDAFFEHLAEEERAACEWEGVELAPDHYPPFGLAGDDYETVARPFYNVWSGFATRKSFSWKDKYRLTDAPDRRIRRLMEKENKKFREEGIRDFNDAVRSLVAFVRKRDPRYLPSKQSEAERQKVLRESAAAQAARSRAANQKLAESYVVPDWAQARADGDPHTAEFSASEEESEVEEIECVVCNKTFKSEKQYEAHEKSKKHVKAVQQLQRQMKRENADFRLDERQTKENAQKEEEPVPNDEEASEVDTADAHSVSDREHDDQLQPDTQEPGDIDGATTEPSGATSEDDEYAPRSEVEGRLGRHDKLPPGTETPITDELETDLLAGELKETSLEGTAQEEKKIGKAKAKRAKKAAKQAPDVIRCAVCNEEFPSRTRLFAHIEEFGHAAPVPQQGKPKAKAKAKGSKKNR